ncbi:MAG: M48 family metallopeptidase [Planctomycetia bacterium]|nr:M48 family metallopeptidase [Planctomycetia bacterium]
MSSKTSYWTIWLNPLLIFYDSVGILLLVGCSSLFKVVQLSQLQGDGIATSLGGELIHRSTTSPQEKRLLNIVDEMAIASGIPVPNVYLLRTEPGINAFAAGFSPESSVIGVTQGALDYLNRDELQGVIAHEFSHILNGDSKMNLRLIGVLFGLEMIVLVGLVIYRNLFMISFASDRDRDNDGKAQAIVLGLLLFSIGIIIIGWIGMFFSNLIRAAVSRQREFLADASAVQFTRNPLGIGGALKKIGCPRVGSMINHSHSVETSHLFFGNIFRPGFFSSLFRTHPDLTVRIQRIDPNFDGTYPEQLLKMRNEAGQVNLNLEENNAAYSVSSDQTKNANSPFSNVNDRSSLPKATMFVSLNQSQNTMPSAQKGAVIAAAIVDSIGQINENNLIVAESLMESIPLEISEQLNRSQDAKNIIWALLIDSKSEIAKKQKDILGKYWASHSENRTSNSNDQKMDDFLQQVEKISTQIKSLSAQIRIPIVQLALPALKDLSPGDYQAFRSVVNELIRCDQRINIFEYTLSALLFNGLDRHFGLTPAPKIRFALFREVIEPFRVAASFLAYYGNEDSEAQKKAFLAAFGFFYLSSELLSRSECSPKAFFAAIQQLALSTPVLKQKLLTAFYCCICDDGIITETEGELIRAISAILNCPMPVWSNSKQ